ncbi:sulfotransferase family protein [Sinomicrobium sp. M5D2P17]
MVVTIENIKYNLPDFIIIGAAKCGTTSLANYLAQHSKVFLPEIKECRFFSGMTPNFQGPGDDFTNYGITRTLEDYSKLFPKAEKGQVFCDASVDYLYYYENTIQKIKELYPKDRLPKLIIMLRNPVNRAFSMYSHLRRDLREKGSFIEAIEAEKEREEANWEWVWQHTKVSSYYKQVKYYYENYSPDKIKVVILEHLVKDMESGINDIQEFLELPMERLDTEKRYNETGDSKSKWMQKLITNRNPLFVRLKQFIPKGVSAYIKSKNLKPIKITPEEYDFFKSRFKEDVELLEGLINLDLSVWKQH